MFILRPDLDQEATANLMSRIVSTLKEHEARIGDVDSWGKRRLAYEIEGFREGYYAVMKFRSGPQAARELDRVLRISEGILRHIIVREDDDEGENS